MTKPSQSKPSKKAQRLYFPPLAQFAIYGIASYVLAAILPFLAIQSAVFFWLSVPLVLFGSIVLLVSVRSFAKAGTTVNPIEPEKADRLVTSGLYRFTRNPMYLGMLLVLFALAFALQNIAAFSGPLLYALSITLFQIIPEERVLEGKFGIAFAAYRKQTRRWL
jgi:protein-S-isoprenylcysteine O-methyltransferase Ste14